MGTITAIQPQRRRGRFNILVDGVFKIAVSEKVVVDQKLAVGRDLDEAKLTETALAEDRQKALASALRLLESRPRSEREITDRLKQRDCTPETITAVIQKLREHGFVDDVQFTAAWIESRARTQPGGRYKLKQELIEKGIAKSTIDEAIGEISEDTEIELAKKALSKRSATIPADKDERRAAYARDAAYLARRGFTWTITKPVLNERYGQSIDDYEE